MDRKTFVDPSESIEDVDSDGAHNSLEVTQRHRIIYKCNFNLMKFPFDQQTCNFTIKIAYEKVFPLRFDQSKLPLVYDGPDVVGQFAVDKMRTYTANDGEEAVFIFSISFHRLYSNQMITMFLPTILLWLLSYFTLFIRVDSFNERIMVSITTLLVLVSLLGSINADLPKTSYYKYIDIWFLWYTANIFCITVFHVILDGVLDNLKEKEKLMTKVKKMQLNQKMQSNKIGPIARMSTVQHDTTKKQSKASVINNAAIKLIPFINFLFLFVYVCLQF